MSHISAGRKWHALDRTEQAKYYEMARKERALHMQRYPGWSARDNYAQVTWNEVQQLQIDSCTHGKTTPLHATSSFLSRYRSLSTVKIFRFKVHWNMIPKDTTSFSIWRQVIQIFGWLNLFCLPFDCNSKITMPFIIKRRSVRDG